MLHFANTNNGTSRGQILVAGHAICVRSYGSYTLSQSIASWNFVPSNSSLLGSEVEVAINHANILSRDQDKGMVGKSVQGQGMSECEALPINGLAGQVMECCRANK